MPSTGKPSGRLMSWEWLGESFEASAGLIKTDTGLVQIKRIDANSVVKFEERLLSAVRSYRRSRDTYRRVNISGVRLKAHAPRENRSFFLSAFRRNK